MFDLSSYSSFSFHLFEVFGGDFKLSFEFGNYVATLNVDFTGRSEFSDLSEILLECTNEFILFLKLQLQSVYNFLPLFDEFIFFG
jgi:hypothetical protein